MGKIFKLYGLTGRAGFTLSELMLACAILLVAILGVLLVFIMGILMNESNNNLVTAVNDAQYVLEQVKSQPYSNITSFISGFDSGQFANLENESITFPEDDVGASIANITVSVGWVERQRSRSFRLPTRIAR